jgi:hypothetical protein
MITPPACLSLLCPTADETDLLRACLWSGAPARDAWQRWQRVVGRPEDAIRRDVSGIKSLLPLLNYSLRRSEAVLTPGLKAVLSSAAMAERMRYETYATICTRACDALATDVAFLVLRGAALACSVYPEVALRHSHDIDVLIHASDIGRATAALRQAGFRDGAFDTVTGTVQMVDVSGMPVTLHDRLLRYAYYTLPLDEMWRRARPIDCVGRTVGTLGADDQLVHICGHAANSRSRDGLKWAVDAWFVLDRTDSLDWERLLATVRAGRLALPLATLLHYLASELEARVPTTVLDHLSRAAAESPRPAQQVALASVRTGKRGNFRSMIGATPSLRGQLEIARWMLLPSPASLRSAEPLRYPRVWPLYYVWRPLGYVGRRLRHLGTSLAQRAASQRSALHEG